MNNETVQTREATPGQYKDIIGTVIQAVPTDLMFVDADGIIGDKTPFQDAIRAVFANYTTSSFVERAIVEWQNFYRDQYHMECDFSQVRIPERPKGFNRLIFVAQGITAQRVYDRLSELFTCWKYWDDSLDSAVPTNERDPKNGSYAIWVRDVVEADEQHKNKSAKDIQGEKLATETLLERLLHEHKFHLETGGHLDVKYITLCTASRNSGGYVPGVHWDGGGSRVDWYGPGLSSAYLRSREVCS